MRVLQKGLSGPDVKKWQTFLVGQGFALGEVDGQFGEKTHQATIKFQQKRGLTADGKVSNKTLAKAMLLGFELISDPTDETKTGPNFPPPPDFPPLIGTAARQAVFGKFAFEPQPLPDNPENIKILGTWEQDNIVKVTIPQLIGVKVAPKTGVVRFHQLAAEQFVALWAAWDDAGLLDRVLTWGRSFVPRFIRGSRKTLSNHSFGTV
jgi:peptidoglycan hydrolase-like protein with peptidoglycan-binding domain